MRPVESAPGTVARRGPGRPRTAGHDERVLDAVVDLLDRGEEVTVNRIVELSGVSRAGIYRRWSSLTELIAAALDRGREPYVISLEGDLLENLLRTFLQQTGRSRPLRAAGPDYPEQRFRLRLRLALSDRSLARAYWAAHVSVRRAGLEAVLREGIRRGELRDDLDIDACMDLINGVFYYQYVVRGVSFDDVVARARCAEAIRTAWRGLTRV